MTPVHRALADTGKERKGGIRYAYPLVVVARQNFALERITELVAEALTAAGLLHPGDVVENHNCLDEHGRAFRAVVVSNDSEASS